MSQFPENTLAGGAAARRLLFLASSAGAILAGAAPGARAAVVDFGDLTLAPGSFYNGGPATNAAGWSSGGVSFGNTFTDFGGGFSAWAGFAYSTVSDTVTAGFGNQYAAYSRTVANAGVYGVAYYSAYDPAPAIGFAGPVAPQSIRLTNTTYAALDMASGSDYSKKFGGATGADPDWLTVTLTGYDAQNAVTGAVTFYLADFRFADGASDYLVDEWTSVDLTGLGTGVTKILLGFASSDTGMFGINTPTYVALDDLAFTPVPEPSAAVALAGLGAWLVASARRRRVSIRSAT